ncbi:MAG: PH domain-containing protein [Sphingobacteriia bacterium]|nr:PH domain-containing protein [Sphingobacteriia bacterium]NCC39040.1 PH domain-containing protein [Gammaproteobacteria bacterium]
MREHESEPIPGLPEHLPPGEEMLWQGAPRWPVLARRAFHVWKIAFYFLLILLWQVLASVAAGQTLITTLSGSLWVIALAAIAIGALMLLAWSMARATIYTITTHRVVMRFGVALPMIVNFPFSQIRSAEIRRYLDDTGDIPLILKEGARASYVILWPHVRPWHFARPQPMLRAIPEASKVAEILAAALARDLEHDSGGTATGHHEPDDDDSVPRITRIS